MADDLIESFSRPRKELLEIAWEEYVRFRGSDEWGEDYKFETIDELSSEFDRERDLTAERILDVAEKLKRSNPSSGTFVHWTNLDDFESFAEKEPELTARLCRSLFGEEESLSDRIARFREQTQKYEISLGTSFFAYLMTSFEPSRYVLYKYTPFSFVSDMLSLSMPSPVEDRYEMYMSVVDQLGEYAAGQGYMEAPTPLDVQDFMYCWSEYAPLRFNIALSYLYSLAENLNDYKSDTAGFLTAIRGFGDDHLEMLKDNYENQEKINAVRYRIVEALLEEGAISESDLAQFKRRKTESMRKTFSMLGTIFTCFSIFTTTLTGSWPTSFSTMPARYFTTPPHRRKMRMR